MSKITLLCLLVHHGVWNDVDHDVFKNIIATCKRIHQYVCSNKPLVQILFKRLAVRFTRCITIPLVGVGFNLGWRLNNKQEGSFLHLYNNGRIYSKVFYCNGKMEGKYTEYDREGRLLRRSFCRNDLMEGETLCWYSNGQISWKGFYRNGHLNGEFTNWHSNGDKMSHRCYRNGQLHGRFTEWQKDGTIRCHYYEYGWFLKDLS